MFNQEMKLEYNGIRKFLETPSNSIHKELLNHEIDLEKFVYLFLPDYNKQFISEALLFSLIHDQIIYGPIDDLIHETLFASDVLNLATSANN